MLTTDATAVRIYSLSIVPSGVLSKRRRTTLYWQGDNQDRLLPLSVILVISIKNHLPLSFFTPYANKSLEPTENIGSLS